MQSWRLTSLKMDRMCREAGDPGETMAECQFLSDRLGTWGTDDVDDVVRSGSGG